MDDHMTGTPGLYTSGRSTSSSSSPGGGPVGSSPALLVVPQPINATKMAAGVQNGGGPQPRKYQCKMCPQVSYVSPFYFWGRKIYDVGALTILNFTLLIMNSFSFLLA